MKPSDFPSHKTLEWQFYGDDDSDEFLTATEADNIQYYEKFINVSVLLPVGADQMEKGVNTGRVKDKKGELRGTYHADPTLDTREYEVIFSDRAVKEYSSNIISENLFAQINQASEDKRLICEIIDHKTDESAVHTDNNNLTDNDGKITHCHTTKGWWLCVRYRDESTSWVKLKDLKDSNPLEFSDYGVAKKISSLTCI